MKKTFNEFGLTAILFAGVMSFGTSAFAQSMSPMEKDIASFSDKFMFQVEIKNTYKTGQVSDVKVFTMDWKPIETAFVSHKSAFLGTGQMLVITAMIPFDEHIVRSVRLCHGITPKTAGRGTAYRGEVCGKYTAKRLS